jgi:DNA polymerase
VFGEGGSDAKIMFIGEAPGRTENATGRPFVGRSGKLLRAMIQAIGVEEKDFYIANIVKDRPSNNRPPEPDEIEQCVKFLKKQIEIIQPKLLVLLGKTAVKGLLPTLSGNSMESLRTSSKNGGFIQYQNVPCFVTYHPSAILRNPVNKSSYREDFIHIQNVFNGL